MYELKRKTFHRFDVYSKCILVSLCQVWCQVLIQKFVFFINCWNFSFAPKRAFLCIWKWIKKMFFFRFFHMQHIYGFTYTYTHLHLWKKIPGCSLKHSNLQLLNATTMKQKCIRDGMCAVMNQCPERLECLAHCCCSFSLFFLLCFAFSIENFERNKKKTAGISHQKLHSLWLLPSLTPFYSRCRTTS